MDSSLDMLMTMRYTNLRFIIIIIIIISALNVQTQGAASQLTKHERFQRSFELYA